jgi:type II restriction enzyme
MNLESPFKNISLTRFLEEIDSQKFSWIIKRLSGNDTGLTGGHQVGLYVPRTFLETFIPEICSKEEHNPSLTFKCYVPSQDYMAPNVKAIYYNSKYHPELGLKKKYDEFRLTCWGGRQSPLQNHEYTGSICMIAAKRTGNDINVLCWIAENADQEDLIEYWLGKEIEPGQIYNSEQLENQDKNIIKLLPKSWFSSFPSGRQIFDFIESQLPQYSWEKTIDELLLKRRSLEFEVFTEVERRDVLPNVKDGFTSVDEFVKYANSVSNRRKSRTGISLELHLESIFRHKQLQFEAQAVTEQNKKPDFLFPSGSAYHNAMFPEFKLHMLASKTCCKDRWRQVINEADRIKTKHLFTLQEGVSENQLDEMSSNGIVLVVPSPIINSFPINYRDKIMNLTGFVDFIKTSQQ